MYAYCTCYNYTLVTCNKHKYPHLFSLCWGTFGGTDDIAKDNCLHSLFSLWMEDFAAEGLHDITPIQLQPQQYEKDLKLIWIIVK